MSSFAIPFQSNIQLFDLARYQVDPGPDNLSINTVRTQTYPINSIVSNNNFTNYDGITLFWVHVYSTYTPSGTVEITYPYTQSGQGSGVDKQISSATYTYMTLSATPAYGITFIGWYTGSQGTGTLISTQNPYNYFYTDSTMSANQFAYAHFSFYDFLL